MAANRQWFRSLLKAGLVGWFERDMAVRYLTQACVFGSTITDAQAEAMWRPTVTGRGSSGARGSSAALIPLNHTTSACETVLAPLPKLGPTRYKMSSRLTCLADVHSFSCGQSFK